MKRLQCTVSLLLSLAMGSAVAACGTCSTTMTPGQASIAGHIIGSGAGVFVTGAVVAGNPAAGALIGGVAGGILGPQLLRCPAAEHLLRNTGVEIVEDQSGVSLLMGSDHLFMQATPPALIRPEYMTVLDKVREVIQLYPQLRLRVTAYTDNVFPEPYRTQITEYQARAVTDYLMANGVDPNRIVAVIGGSSNNPIAANNSVEGRSTNRRVEITLEGDVA